MATTMVVKLLGRNLVYSILQNRIFNLWKPSHSFHLMDIENAYFLAKFQSREDYEMILTLFPNTVMAWVHLPGLPGVLYKKLILEEIDKPLVLHILVNGMMQRVEYESFSAVCFSCGCYGHMQDLCPYNEPANADAKVKDANKMNLPVKEKPVELR
ncbi:hypothetical protein Goari_014188 [Gossypium aridum]|uniref:CCHC-type domain-containing protein n=1 Tax=Gossypium aridum TaxID=34290 RepID=A0A7J8XHC9_GOSAI|nr:hypothetical protein [Gossypium aridum]